MAYIGKLFNKFDVNFPIDEDLVIILGHNGSGKTKTLELLYDYNKKQNNNVIYFPSERVLNVDLDEAIAIETMLKLQNKIPNEIISSECLKYNYKGSYINSGSVQMINFATNIINSGNNLVVIIDLPERNLDLHKQRQFIDFIKGLQNVNKLILVTHQPEIISKHIGNVIDIKKIVNIYQ